MAVTQISPIYSAQAGIFYATKDIDDADSLVVAIGTTPETAVRDFAVTRAKYGRRNIHRQAYHEITSYSTQELDRRQPDAKLKALMIEMEKAHRFRPGRQAVIAVESSGHGGKIHVHTIHSNLSDAPIKHKERRYEAGRAMTAEMASWQSTMGNTNTVLRDANFMSRIGLKAYDNARFVKQRGREAEKITKDDLDRRSKGKYVWRDDLRARIKAAASVSPNVETFKHRLAADGVDVVERGKEQNFSYAFTDHDVNQRRAKASGSRGLGAAYSRTGVETMMAEAQHQGTQRTHAPAQSQHGRRTGPRPARTDAKVSIDAGQTPERTSPQQVQPASGGDTYPAPRRKPQKDAGKQSSPQQVPAGVPRSQEGLGAKEKALIQLRRSRPELFGDEEENEPSKG